MFKIGDKVKVKPEECSGYIKTYDIKEILYQTINYPSWMIQFDTFRAEVCEKYLILVDETINQQEKTMNIKEQFLLAITSEPQKSFRKAGIINGDDLLTDDGQKVFLSWLLKLNQDAFKKEVVDPILEDMKEEKK